MIYNIGRGAVIGQGTGLEVADAQPKWGTDAVPFCNVLTVICVANRKEKSGKKRRKNN